VSDPNRQALRVKSKGESMVSYGFMGASVVAPADVEQLGNLGDGFDAGADVAHGAAGVAVPCLGHDVLEFYVLLAQVRAR